MIKTQVTIQQFRYFVKKQTGSSCDFAAKKLPFSAESTYSGASCGFSFGADDCVRLSYALSDADLEEGLRRIKEFVEELQ